MRNWSDTCIQKSLVHNSLAMMKCISSMMKRLFLGNKNKLHQSDLHKNPAEMCWQTLQTKENERENFYNPSYVDSCNIQIRILSPAKQHRCKRSGDT